MQVRVTRLLPICLFTIARYAGQSDTVITKKNVDIICRSYDGNKPVVGAVVTVFFEERPVAETITDTIGLARVKLQPGKYKFVAMRPDCAEKKVTFTIRKDGVDYIRLLMQRKPFIE